VSRLDLAGHAATPCPRKRAFGIAEELTGEQLARQAATVECDVRAAGVRTGAVDALGDSSLPAPVSPNKRIGTFARARRSVLWIKACIVGSTVTMPAKA